MNQIERKGSVRVSVAAATDAGAILSPPHHALSVEARAASASLSRPPISTVLISGFARLIEFIAFALTGLAVYFLYVHPVEGLDAKYIVPLSGGPPLAVFLIQISGGYSIAALRGTARQVGRIFGAWTFVFAAMAVVAFFAELGDTFSRLWFATWYLAGLAALFLLRTGISVAVRRWTVAGLLERRAVIVGGGQPAELLIQALAAQPEHDVRICGIFDDRKDDRSPAIVAGYPKLGTIAELVEFSRIAWIDILIVSLPITAEDRLLQLLKQLWVLPVDIRLSAHTSKLRFHPHTYSFIGKVPFFNVVDKPIAHWDVVAKWTLDRVLGSLILLLALPVMLVVALAIKLDSKGPIFFKQPRYGFNNELIKVHKFRSMYAEATDAGGGVQATKDDPRVTRVGRFIRKTSLDELPQLINVVFKGNLSLVGPRPHPVQCKAENRLFEEVVDGYFARHRVKPGITGWAQVNGWRGETDTREKIQQRVEHDLDYIANWSVLLDLYIIALTPIRLLYGKNAY